MARSAGRICRNGLYNGPAAGAYFPVMESPVADPLGVAPEEAATRRSGPPSPDTIWCELRGLRVSVAECATGCVAPEQRPVCWIETPAFLARLEDDD